MTQRFLADGRVAPVTVIEAGPCTVVQVKNQEKDGYQAVQIGFGQRKKQSKSLQGHLKQLGNFRYLREFDVEKVEDFKSGQYFDVQSFKAGDLLAVTAVSKGKGFQGVVKRHGFHGHPPTHGHKDQERMPGSIGATEPQRVFKGTRMAGHMGVDTVTVKNLEVIDIDTEKNLLYVKGAVPGSHNALVKIVASGDLTLSDGKPVATVVKETPVAETTVEAEEKVEEAKEEVKVEAPVAENVEAPVENKEEVKAEEQK